MSIEPAYPNAASDPRLTDVHTLYKTLRREIDRDDWDSIPVTPARRQKLSALRQALDEGQLYLPKF